MARAAEQEMNDLDVLRSELLNDDDIDNLWERTDQQMIDALINSGALQRMEYSMVEREETIRHYGEGEFARLLKRRAAELIADQIVKMNLIDIVDVTTDHDRSDNCRRYSAVTWFTSP